MSHHHRKILASLDENVIHGDGSEIEQAITGLGETPQEKNMLRGLAAYVMLYGDDERHLNAIARRYYHEFLAIVKYPDQYITRIAGLMYSHERAEYECPDCPTVSRIPITHEGKHYAVCPQCKGQWQRESAPMCMDW